MNEKQKPTAITGTWSEVERCAWYVYENIDRGTTDWELAEAVLVLLGLSEQERMKAGTRDIWRDPAAARERLYAVTRDRPE